MSDECIVTKSTLTSIADAIRKVLNFTGTIPTRTIPSYIRMLNPPSYVVTEANRVIEQVKSHQNDNTFTFMAISDSHYLASNTYICNGILHAAQAMYLIRKGANVDFAVNLGDNSWGSSISGSETTIEEGLNELRMVNNLIDLAFRDVPNFRTPGNHDSIVYNYALNDNDYFDADELFEIFGTYNTGATFQSGEENRGYCYRDFDDWKLRVIVMNTCDLKDLDPANEVDLYTSGTQMQWFAETIDLSSKSDMSEWNILILSHHPLDFGISINCNKILKAYYEGKSVSLTRDGITISYDYADKNGAYIIGNIHGHNHNYLKDKLRYLVSGSTTSPIKANRMCVPNACYSRSNERGQNGTTDVFDIEFGETTTYNKTTGTASDTSFYVITVDTAAKMVYADHYGAGYSQAWSYEKTYTNLLFTATTEPGGTEIYNGVGYKEDTRMNSTPEIVDCTGMDLTGWIRYEQYDICRVKNVTLTGGATPYFIRYQDSYSPVNLAISWMGDPDEDGVYTFEISQYEGGYFRLSVGDINENTIITLNEEIAGIEEGSSAIYTITNNLSNTETDNTLEIIEQNQSYVANLVASKGILGNVTVKMGGVDVTSSYYSDGAINITSVTGNIEITATATTGNLLSYMTTEYGGTEIYNGIGYKTDTRFNSSREVVDCEGMCLTGYLKVTDGDVLRIKNITVDGTATSYWVRYNRYGAPIVLNISTIGDPDEDGVYTVTIDQYTLGFRLSIGKIDDSTIITLNEEIAVSSYTVTNNLTNVTSNNASTNVFDGSSYTAILTPKNTYNLSTVKVTMGGTDITSNVYANGMINIPKVTGDIVITATATEPNYTNLVPTAEDAAGTGIYNGVGYKNGIYLSSSGGTSYDSSDANYTATGWIPYKVKSDGTFPSIYIKGLDWVEESHSRLFFYYLNGSAKNMIFGTNTNLTITGNSGRLSTMFTLEDLGDTYWKLTPTDTFNTMDTALSTPITWLRFSLKGTGENLIVTLDEPIE